MYIELYCKVCWYVKLCVVLGTLYLVPSTKHLKHACPHHGPNETRSFLVPDNHLSI